MKCSGWVVLAGTAMMVACSTMNKSVKAPQAQKIEQKLKKFDDVRIDPYYWMRERDSKPVLDHLKQENDYAEAQLKSSAELKDQIFAEMKSRIKKDDATVPYFKNGYYYYVR